MVDYTDTPFPGDYQPGQVEATPFLFQSQLPTHFSPATSDQSFQNPQPGHNRPATSTGVPGTPQLGAARTLGPGGEMNFGQQPMQPGGGGGGGHSHSFSTASLPSLASSSGSFSMPSHPDNQPGQMSMSAGPAQWRLLPPTYSPAALDRCSSTVARSNCSTPTDRNSR